MNQLDDRAWMARAIALSRLSPPVERAFSVGAVIVSADGQEVASGYSRETDLYVHAEESALSKVAWNDPRLLEATLYSTLEPCSERKSRALTCTQLVLQSGIRRVVIAWREPDLFVRAGAGVEALRSEGVNVIELLDIRDEARAVNAHLWH
ncbi:deaminase [Streptomyces sp. FIT100]|uniref:deaminase n=1 Tax=Streptomyces sp. FIT100 TaxID=2837956 RepID=UPI0028BEE52D|nr:deaminase [Streptomyces sp. FIT100]